MEQLLPRSSLLKAIIVANTGSWSAGFNRSSKGGGGDCTMKSLLTRTRGEIKFIATYSILFVNLFLLFEVDRTLKQS